MPKLPNTPEIYSLLETGSKKRAELMEKNNQNPAYQNFDARVANLRAEIAEINTNLAHMTTLRDALKDPDER